MASDKGMMGSDGKFQPTWGDTVRISQLAPAPLRPGALAAVVGIREIETEGQVEEFTSPLGTRLYLVEFGDGDSLEVPEKWIEAPS